MAEDRKGELHKKRTDDTHNGEISSEEIENTVSEIEQAGHGRGDETEGREAPGEKATAGDAGTDALAGDLETARREAKENYDKYLRSAAEFDNYRKRIQKETEEARRFANEELIKALIPVVDNLERAIIHVEEGSDSGPLLDGVKMIHKQFMDVLAKHGVEQVVAIGKPFDPNFHQALMQVKTNDAPPNTVVSEVTKGYLLSGRLIRPSMVGVSVAGEKQGAEGGGEAAGEKLWGNEEYEAADEDGTEAGSAAEADEKEKEDT
jgi:molecular chaperone GrpE